MTKVLVVDPDAERRRILTDTFQVYGYEVIEVASAEEALEIFCSTGPGEIEILITDQDLGQNQLSGSDLIASARVLRGTATMYILVSESHCQLA